MPKKGESSNPANYRPIAICSILSKIMETIINHRLMAYLELNALISDRQYGFRRNRSTGDLMAYLTEKWNQAIHGFGESKVVALDITKAFDRVWHEALVHKVSAYGVGNSFVRWFFYKTVQFLWLLTVFLPILKAFSPVANFIPYLHQ